MAKTKSVALTDKGLHEAELLFKKLFAKMYPDRASWRDSWRNTAIMTAKTASLARLITAERLRRLAGEVWFARGKAYCSEGRVTSVRRDGDVIVAAVSGTRPYRVRLWLDGGELSYSCTCPLGAEGEFCKHCVAVGLAWLAQSDQPDGATSTEGVEANDLRAYLSGLTVSELVDMILARANEDESLHQRLVLRAAKSRKRRGGPDVKVWKRAFEDAIERRQFVSYDEAGGYAAGIDAVIDSVEELLKDGHAAAVITLAEYGLEAIENAIENVDDSDGEMGQLLHRLQDMHLAACRRAPPDCEILARRLFEWELLGQWDVFRKAVTTYADVLGQQGLAVYHRLAEVEWKNVPTLAPGDGSADRYGKRLNITSIMEVLARQSGDVETLVEVKRRDLSTPYDFLAIATLYKEAGLDDKALAWAERGWRAFAVERSDDRLRAFLADAYQDRSRHKEAMTLVWDAFSDRPVLESYRTLHRYAKRASEWPSWREKALSCIRERITATTGGHRVRGPGSPVWASAWNDYSVLVEIFLWERRAEDAWRAANEGGCSASLWLQLAEKREKDYPRDALTIYRDHIAKLVTQTDGRAYQEAMKFLHKVRELLTVVDEAQAFQRYVAELRAAYRRKRNFIKLLDQKGW